MEYVGIHGRAQYFSRWIVMSVSHASNSTVIKGHLDFPLAAFKWGRPSSAATARIHAAADFRATIARGAAVYERARAAEGPPWAYWMGKGFGVFVV